MTNIVYDKLCKQHDVHIRHIGQFDDALSVCN